MRPFPAPVLLAGLAIAAFCPTASAQLAIEVEGGAAFMSNYVDRGVILTNQPVIRPDLGVRLGVGTGTMGLLLGAVIEPARLQGDEYFSMAPGDKRPNVAMFRPALEVRQPLGPASFTFRAEYRLFPNQTGLMKPANTGVVATELALPGLPLAPGVLLEYDVGGITGAYVEGRIEPRVRFSDGFALVLGTRAGYAVNQTVDSTVAALAPYARSGLTHIEGYAGWDVSAAGALIRPWVSVTYVPDPAISPDGFMRQEGRVVTVGVRLTVKGRFPKPQSPAE